MSTAEPGTVYLVGAGPGDPGLVTVKGLELIHAADAIVYDALVNPCLLREAHLSAELIDAGKRHGRHSMSQVEINRLLVELAHTCRVVVRLKGGDPFVFGRGGEELSYLRAAGVPVEVVPGVTSAIAALAYAGVPVTYRNLAANFVVITGHPADGVGKEPCWAALAQLDTLVILMGMSNLAHITRQLIAARRDPQTPALAVSWGTWPQQASVLGTLATLAEQVALAELKAPAVIVIGAVAALAETLSWFPCQYQSEFNRAPISLEI